MYNKQEKFDEENLMSLKVEQFLDNSFFTESEPRLFTTGAYLVPMRITNDGKERFVWIVDEFKDDTYLDGELCTPNVYSDDFNNMIEDE
jgi:hypothetical protein